MLSIVRRIAFATRAVIGLECVALQIVAAVTLLAPGHMRRTSAYNRCGSIYRLVVIRSVIQKADAEADAGACQSGHPPVVVPAVVISTVAIPVAAVATPVAAPVAVPVAAAAATLPNTRATTTPLHFDNQVVVGCYVAINRHGKGYS